MYFALSDKAWYVSRVHSHVAIDFNVFCSIEGYLNFPAFHLVLCLATFK